ncbi:MAG: bifunctional 4-hydroxy-2-oxoglutarate aldolase/2-dehydro-3-deoxy-phosphogluconate aldolase [Lysobacteraceae bacterium]
MSWTTEARNAAIDAVFAKAPVLPVIVIDRVEDAVPLARALVAGGLPVLEVTLRTAAALEGMRRIAAEVEGAVLGAGTVLAPADLEASAAAGCTFAISPGATPALYHAADASPIAGRPAVPPALEERQGLAHGHQRFKFFPAVSSGGIPALKGFAGPFPQVRFCPTGGIDATSAPDFLALPNVGTVGGSWMLPKDAIVAGDWARIERLAREAVALRPG